MCHHGHFRSYVRGTGRPDDRGSGSAAEEMVEAGEEPGERELGIGVDASVVAGVVNGEESERDGVRPGVARGGAEEWEGVGVDDVVVGGRGDGAEIAQPEGEEVEGVAEGAAGAAGAFGVGCGEAGRRVGCESGGEPGAGGGAKLECAARGFVPGEEGEGAADGALPEAGGQVRLIGVGAGALDEKAVHGGVAERPESDGEEARSEGREEYVRVGSGEDEPGRGRRLFEDLEEGIRGFLTGLLGDEELGVADDEDLTPGHGGSGGAETADGAHLCEEQPDGLVFGAGEERVGAALGDGVEARFLEGFGEALGVGGAPRARQGEEPVHVGVLELDGEAAGAAAVARPVGLRFVAHEEAAEPEGECLPPDAALAMDEDGPGELAAADGGGQVAADVFVPDDSGQERG